MKGLVSMGERSRDKEAFWSPGHMLGAWNETQGSGIVQRLSGWIRVSCATGLGALSRRPHMAIFVLSLLFSLLVFLCNSKVQMSTGPEPQRPRPQHKVWRLLARAWVLTPVVQVGPQGLPVLCSLP